MAMTDRQARNCQIAVLILASVVFLTVILIVLVSVYAPQHDSLGSLEEFLVVLTDRYGLRPPIDFDPARAEVGVIRGRHLFCAPLYTDASRVPLGHLYFDKDCQVRALYFVITRDSADSLFWWTRVERTQGAYPAIAVGQIDRCVQGLTGRSPLRLLYALHPDVPDPRSEVNTEERKHWAWVVPKEKEQNRDPYWFATNRACLVDVLPFKETNNQGKEKLWGIGVIIRDRSSLWE